MTYSCKQHKHSTLELKFLPISSHRGSFKLLWITVSPAGLIEETAGGILIIFWWAAGQFCLQECVTLSISCHVYLFWWETCAYCRQGSITTARNNYSARILKSIRNKHIVVMKTVCENPLAMMLEYVFFDFAPFGLEDRVSSLGSTSGWWGGGGGRERKWCHLWPAHIIRSCHTSTEKCG